jgi:hypothetical protein
MKAELSIMCEEKIVQRWPEEAKNQSMILWLSTEPESTWDTNSTFKSFQNRVFALYRRWLGSDGFEFDGNCIIVDDVPSMVYNN